MDWFTAIDDKSEGPTETAALGARIALGELSPESLVWRDGLDDWSPVKDQPELAAFIRRLPPPLPRKQSDIPVESIVNEPFNLPQTPALPLPGSPWSRYFARQIDIMLLGFAVAFGAIIGSSFWYPRLYFGLIGMPEAASGLMWIGLSFLANAIVISIFGNSIGKTVFGLKAIPIMGDRPGIIWNIKREFKVWLYGLAAGIPIITLFTASKNHKEVKAGRPATYDFYFATVTKSPISTLRRASGMLLGVAVIAVGVGFSAWAKEADRVVASAKPWTNTITGRTVTLPGGWTPGKMNADDGSSLTTFTSQNNVRSVFLGAEEASQFPEMSAYAAAIENVVTDSFAFQGTWTASTIGNTSVLRRDAVSKAEGMAATYVMWKRSGRYWRLVIVDGLAKPGTKLEATLVVETLMQSVP